MNWKIVFIGGVAYYLVQFLVSTVTGYFIHSPEAGVLADAYRATASFWRPELNRIPPDTSLVLTMWVPSGLIGSFLLAGVYAVMRPSLAGPGWLRGLKFGLVVVIFGIVNALGYRGRFDLPDQIWIWSMIGATLTNLPAGTVLGWLSQKFAPVKA